MHTHGDEAQRLNAVRRYDILDTPPDGAFDRITALAARLFQVPIAIVSIVDSDRIWFKSHQGIDATEVGRDLGLCASAILHPGPYIISDASTDIRTLANPLVAGELGLRFYAAVPLITTDGFSLGTMCVIDKKPRELNELEIANLEDLASLVMDQLELRLTTMGITSELINARSQAEKANQAKTDFLTNLSHELRTPLNSILGFAQILEISKPEPHPHQLLNLQHIIQAGWYMLKLVNETLDLAVIESGGLSTLMEALPIYDVLDECIAMVEMQAQKKRICLKLCKDNNHWLVYADRTRVKQALINLLSNAIKYNHEGGTVEVQCSNNEQKVIKIYVKDSGFGVPPEKIDRMFQAFERLGQEAGNEEGAGIGLAVTRKLVELMGGTIGVESTVGVGSLFWIELPAIDDERCL